MKTPTCAKCGSSTFEMGEIKIANANFRHNAIVCSHCGAIVATEELMSVMHMLGKIAEKLGVRFGS